MRATEEIRDEYDWLMSQLDAGGITEKGLALRLVQDIPDLLVEVERLRAERERLRTAYNERDNRVQELRRYIVLSEMSAARFYK